MKSDERLELVLDVKAELGEGPCWDEVNGLLYWVDIPAGELHAFSPQTTTHRTIHIGSNLSTVAPVKGGGLILTTEQGFHTLSADGSTLTFICDPESDKPSNRFNDGKCDPAGRFWAGTMSKEEETGTGSLYRLGTDYQPHRAVPGVSISNGLGWSPDLQTMYYIDSPTKKVMAYDYDNATGDIRNPRVAVHIPEGQGVPDGMTVDEEGMIWVAQWDGARISRWNPTTGELLDTVRIPAARVTSCVFGGEEMNELYITTAREGLTEEELAEQPHAGGVFRLKTAVKGMPTYAFG